MPTLPVTQSIANTRYAGLVPEDYNPNSVPLGTLERMLRRDPHVAYAYTHLARSVRKRIGDYTNDDQRVADYVREHVLPTAQRHMSRLLKALFYGVAIAQPRYELAGDGALHLSELVGLSTHRFWDGPGFKRDDVGRVDRVHIDTLGWVHLVDPDSGVRQLIHYATGDHDGSPWGRSNAVTAYNSWFIKNGLDPAEAVGLERHATGTLVVQVGDDEVDEETGKTHSQQLAEAWAETGANAFMAVAGDDIPTLHQPGWGAESPFAEPNRRKVAEILLAFGGQSALQSQETTTGTFAQSKSTQETFIGEETDLAEEVADGVLLDQVIAPAVWQQFGPRAPRGDLTIRDPAPPNLAEWAQIISTLEAAGFVSADSERHLRFVGERFGLAMDDLLDTMGGGTGARE